MTFRKSEKCEVINMVIHTGIKAEKTEPPVDVGKGPMIGLEMTESGMEVIELDGSDSEEQSFA